MQKLQNKLISSMMVATQSTLLNTHMKETLNDEKRENKKQKYHLKRELE